MLIQLDKLRLDGGTQLRAHPCCQSTIDDYRDAMLAGDTFPPVTVFNDGTDYWLADGFQRTAAWKLAKPGQPIECDVRDGTRSDALWFSAGANRTHGSQRTSADKRNAIKAALKHPNSANLSNAQIARHVGVSDKTVASVRQELQSSSEIPKITRKQVTRRGKTYRQDTANIGKRRSFLKMPKHDVPAQPVPETPKKQFKYLADEDPTALRKLGFEALIHYWLKTYRSDKTPLDFGLFRDLADSILACGFGKEALNEIADHIRSYVDNDETTMIPVVDKDYKQAAKLILMNPFCFGYTDERTAKVLKCDESIVAEARRELIASGRVEPNYEFDAVPVMMLSPNGKLTKHEAVHTNVKMPA